MGHPYQGIFLNKKKTLVEKPGSPGNYAEQNKINPKAGILCDSICSIFLKWRICGNGEKIDGFQGFQRIWEWKGSACVYMRVTWGVFIRWKWGSRCDVLLSFFKMLHWEIFGEIDSDSLKITYNVGDLGLIPGLRRSPGGGYGNPLLLLPGESPAFLPGESPWTEEPSSLQSVGLQSQKWLNN